MSWGTRRKDIREARELVREAERMLDGRTIESYIARRERVPAWSLISLLSHSSRVEMMKLAHPSARPDPSGWSGTMARVARELLDLTWDDSSLLSVQRQSLVPLELELLGGTVQPPCNPAELYEMVAVALEYPLSPGY
jgi:hypothetical protein